MEQILINLVAGALGGAGVGKASKREPEGSNFFSNSGSQSRLG